MKNKFCEFIYEKWPPRVNDRVLKNSNNEKVSKAWSQYLECLIQDYAKENGMYFLEEVNCKENKNKSLDYLIAEGSYMEYFEDTGQREENVNWHAVIEAQWDKKTKNMLEDFKNLTGWSPSSDDKGRVAIFNIGGGKMDWEDTHEKLKKKLKKKVNSKKGYLILLTTRYKEKGETKIGFSAYYDWKRCKRSRYQ